MNTTTLHPLLGELSPDPIGQFLGTTEYSRFKTTKGLVGLAKATEERLDILAIISPAERSGLVREFFNDAKQQFKTIVVWEVWNHHLESALKRYGFSQDIIPNGSRPGLTNLRWDRGNQ